MIMEKQDHSAELLFPELSYSIIGAAMDIHNGLGPGWDEWDYHRAMLEIMQDRGHQVISHDRQGLEHRGKAVDHFELDLLIDGLVILELKHIKTNFHPKHYTQIINYLKRWDESLGILINFGLEKLRYQRVPFTSVSGSTRNTGNWSELQSPTGKLVAASVNEVVCRHGLGYGADVYKKLIWAELEHAGGEIVKPSLSPRFGNLCFGERAVDAILIGTDLMVLVSASSTGTSATDLGYLKTYMNQAGVRCGILVNIGSSEIQLRGVL